MVAVNERKGYRASDAQTESPAEVFGGRTNPAKRKTRNAISVGMRRAFGFVGALVLCQAVLITALVGPSFAAQTRNYTGTSFGPGGVVGTQSFESLRGLAVDQSKGYVYVYDAAEGGAVYKFDTDGKVVPFSAFPRSYIAGVGVGNPGEGQIAVAPAGSPGNTAGDIYVATNTTVKVFSEEGAELGTVGTGETCGVAVSPAGKLVIGSYGETVREYVPTSNPPTDQDLVATGEAKIGLCNVAADGRGQIYAANYLGSEIARFAAIGDAQPTQIAPGGQTLFSDPVTDDLSVDRGDVVATYDPGGTQTGLFGEGQLTGSVGVAVYDASEIAYVADATTGRVKIFGKQFFLPTVTAGEASFIDPSEAVATGTVDPEGVDVTECFFEYGVEGEGLAETAPCETMPPTDSEPDPVSARLTGLEPGVTYQFRIVAANENGTERSAVETFTGRPPQISEVRAFDADQHSASLEALIDPGLFDTSYKIEWGPDDSYGSVATSGSITALSGSARISARIAGLQEGATYHYRVVATNGAGGPRVESRDRTVETLDACGLLEGRCPELASERESGSIATPGRGISLFENELKALAAERSGALAYISEGGYPGATRGGNILYQAVRSPTGWMSSQLSPAVTARDEQSGIEESSNSSRTLALSPELSCGVMEATQPIPGTTKRMQEILEAGGANLYRWNGGDSFTPITYLPPEEPLPTSPEIQSLSGKGYFAFAGMASDCSRIYFASMYRYPGSQVVGEHPLYEWSEGRLRAVGFVPDGENESATVALPGNDKDYILARADRNAVSDDGTKIFFTAERITGRNPAEVGRRGLFVRQDGTMTMDVSASETDVPDTNPAYQWATPDGSKVFFTAPAGLTEESNAEGTDLYLYDFGGSNAGHRLHDLSVNPLGAEAGVVGMVGASDDGSRVYFAATGRLIAGAGLSADENAADDTYSLYLWEKGRLRFVASVHDSSRLLLTDITSITSQVSPDGRYLTFETLPPPAANGSTTTPEVYLFDAGIAKEAVSCVSCMPGGRLSVRGNAYIQLPVPPYADPALAHAPPRALVETPAGPSVVFSSLDDLAPGATVGETNFFEWSHGQVALLAAEPPGLLAEGNSGEAVTERNVYPFGASVDGIDIYFGTPGSLTPEDSDGRMSVYDARIGGGFPQSVQGTPACAPETEGACQGAATSPPKPPSPLTPHFVGPRNRKSARCGKDRVNKHGHCRRPARRRRPANRHRKRHKRQMHPHKGRADQERGIVK